MARGAARAAGERLLRGRDRAGRARPVGVPDPGLGRSLRELARRARSQGGGRPGRPERRAVRGPGALRRRHSRRVALRSAGALAPQAQERGQERRAPHRRRPRAGALRLLVRAVPALVGRLPWRCRGAARHRRARLRHRLPASRAPDRRDAPQGAQQHRARAQGRSREPVGDRRRGGRPRRAPSRPRQRRRLRRDGGGRARRGHRAGARLRDPDLARPPVAPRAPGVVPPPARRHDQVRREPAEALPGHPQRRLGHVRARGALECAQGRRPRLVRPRHPRLPRRQPAHEADAVLGVADRRGACRLPGGDLPGRGVHAPGADDDARQDRLLAVVHLLRLEEHEGRARRVRRAGAVVVGVLPPQHVAEHARHPQRVPPARRPAGVRGTGSSSPRRSRRATGSTRATRRARTCRCARGARSTSTRRSTR